MTKPYPTIVLRDTTIFEIEPFTELTILLICTRTQLRQECRLTRVSDSTIDIKLKEYGGSQFHLNVALNTRIASLVEPDLSWHPQQELYPRLVLQTIGEMLAIRHSNNQVILKRESRCLERK